MRQIVGSHGVDKVKLCLDHVARSDYWGADPKGKFDGIKGFGKAIEAIYTQAQRYLEKVKATAAAKRR